MGVVRIAYALGSTELDTSEDVPELSRRINDSPHIRPRTTREPEEALATALRRTAQAADLDLGKIIAHLSTNNKEN